MNKHDEKLMLEHGITAETKVVFHYGGYLYERLLDAVSYAKIRSEASPKIEEQTYADEM